MRDPFDLVLPDEEKFTSPDGAVRSIPGAVPGDTKRWQFDFIFRDAGQGVRDMVLNPDNCLTTFLRKLRGEIIRMQIRRDAFWRHVVEFRQIRANPAERGVRLLGFQITDVLAEENIFADGQRHRVFEVRTDGENDFGL